MSHQKRILRWKRIFLSVCILVAFSSTATWGQSSVTVDFSISVDPPLLKNKFNVYQTPLAGLDRLLRDNVNLKDIAVRSLRFETAWGKNIDFNPPSISGFAPNFKYNRADYTTYVQSVIAQDAEPLLTMGYTPNPLKPVGDEWRNTPNSMAAWQQINYDYAAYWSSLQIKPINYEIWNEPDLSIFFLGSKQDYFQLYKYGAAGIKRGDPDAKVGGPVAAFNGWHADFLSFVEGEKLPIDFLSGHAYGTFDWQLGAMRNALNSAKWNSVEMYMTEYASYTTDPPNDIRPHGDQERYVAAGDFFSDALGLLAYNDLGKVYWAQWSDVTLKDSQGNWFLDPNTDKMGLLDYSGNPKALYNAFKIYNELPVDRNEVTLHSTDLKSMASSDKHTAGVVIWNTSEVEATADIKLNNLPIESGMIELYRIDAAHSSYYENRANSKLAVVETFPLSANFFKWTGSIPAKGVIYLKALDGSGESELKFMSVAKVIRTHHWFPDRFGTSFADFDRQTWTTRLGMGSAKDKALAQVGVVMENIPAIVNVNASSSGTMKDLDDNSIFAVRLDFQDLSGQYIHSVLYHAGLYHDGRNSEFPWGTKQKPDKIIPLNDLTDFNINIKDEAPEGFRGRVIFSGLLENTGKDSRAKIKLTKASGEIIPVQELNVTEVKKQDVGSLNIFPNPFNNRIRVEYPEEPELSFYMEDLLGRKIKALPHEQTGNGFEISTEFIKPGAYILTVENREGIIGRQTIIKN